MHRCNGHIIFRLRLLILLLCVGTGSLKAQEKIVLGIYSGSISIPELPDDVSFDRLVIPLRRVQNLFMIEAEVDGRRGNYILDTGAPGLVLNSTYFSGGKLLEAAAAYGVTGGGAAVYRYRADSIRLDQLIYRDLQADLADLSHIENARGVQVYGLLGTGLFRHFEMEVDMGNNMLVLYRIDKEGEPLLPDSTRGQPELVCPLDVTSGLYFVTGQVGKKKLTFVLDTGAEINVLSNMVNNQVLSQFSLSARTQLKGSGAQSRQVLTGQLNTLTFGPIDFAGMTFILTDLSQLETAYDTHLDGMLGYGFMSQGVIRMNPKKKLFSMYMYKEEEK